MRSRFLLLFPLLFIHINSVFAQQSCSELSGTVERVTYGSDVADMEMVYSVYLPPCYAASGEIYPVVYLMHGSNDDHNQWLRFLTSYEMDRGILHGELPPMIMVFPFGDSMANDNSFERASWQNIFLEELMPHAEARYRIDARREMRAIGGISRGGFWAFNIAFRHPELFSSVGGHSAFFNPDHAPDEHNPLDLALNAVELDDLHIWLDRGEDDFAAPGLDEMHDRLQSRSVAHEYVVYPEGQHENAHWRAHIADYLTFYAAGWSDRVIPPEPAAMPNPDAGVMLFLPAISFPSLQHSLDPERLIAVLNGDLDSDLILDAETLTALNSYRVLIHPDTRIVRDGALFSTLWHNRDAYTLLPFDRFTPQYRVHYVGGEHPLDGDLSAYPFAFASNTPNYYTDRLTRFTLSGVTALARHTMEALDEYGVEWAGEAILPYVNRADFFHTSNEVSFHPTCLETGDELRNELSFCSRDTYFDLLTYLGLDVVELTGNHNNDYGFDAYRRSLEMYQDAGITTVGGGDSLEDARSPLLLEHNGNRIAMAACNWFGPYYALVDEEEGRPGAAYCDWNWLSDTLPRLAEENDLLIVSVQYQEFEQYTPTEEQRFDFHGLALLGADVVVGTQAHKPQTFEFYDAGRDDDVFIHYGLGNLFFDQQFWGNRRFFMDTLFIYEGRLLTVDLFTGIIDDRARPRPMTVDERENFLYFMLVQQNEF